ncbi:MAG: DNA polymerase IV [bacterium]
MKRYILLDLDAFYVSVERAENPELEGKPVVVCGNPKRKGVVASASYEVRPFGIHSGMPAGVAMRKCPQAIFLPPRHSLYVDYSRRVLKIASAYTPHIEVVSVDEAFLEVSGCEMLFGSAEEIGRTIQRRIREELHLPASVGIASTRIVAKIACERGKPNGFVSIPPGEEIAFLRPLPVSELWGVGEKMAQKLNRMGILTIGDLMDFPTHRLKEEFGIYGPQVQWLAQGKCDIFLPYLEGRKSIGLNHTLWENSADKVLLEKILYALCEEITAQMREEGIQGRRVTVTVRYGDYSTFSHQTTLKVPTESGREVFEEARKLFYELWDGRRQVRLLGVRVSLLSSTRPVQENFLFPAHLEDKKVRLNHAIDRIRRKYGERAIIPATLWRKKEKMREEKNEGEVEHIHYPGSVRHESGAS